MLKARSQRRVLVTTCDLPWPANTGKRMRSRLLCEVAAEFGAVDVLALTEIDPAHPSGAVPAEWGTVDVTVMPPQVRSMATGVVRVATHWWPGVIAIRDWSAELAFLQAHAGQYDLVIFGSLVHAEALGEGSTDHVVVDMDDIESAKITANLAVRGQQPMPAHRLWQLRVDRRLWRRLEGRFVTSAATALVASELDLRRLAKTRSYVVPNYYPDVHPIEPLPRNASIALVGNFAYPPNRDAAQMAVSEVLPLVRREVPDVRLRIVGRAAQTLPDQLLTAVGVDLVGEVDSIASELSHCAVSLVPVRYGGGTRIKIIESFALGVPVVSTSVGCEGLAAAPGIDLLVADDPAGLAQACCHVLADHQLASKLATAGRELFEREFSYAHAKASLRVALDQAIGG
ncbi:MAG: glycosyltransferase family 4 protein [Candidatus Nanopelagicales bacterium]